MDTRYRDMCVSSAILPVNAFDTYTGQPQGWSDVSHYDAIASYYEPPPRCTPLAQGTPAPSCNDPKDWNCIYPPPVTLPDGYCDPYPIENCPTDRGRHFADTIWTGTVEGAKPTEFACMPIRDTGRYQTTYPYAPLNNAFGYYMQANDAPIFDPVRTGVTRPADVYGNASTSFYQSQAFFGAEGALAGCPMDALGFAEPLPTPPLPHHVEDLLRLRQAQSDLCYKYIILSHGDAPWRTTELHNGTNSDPLSSVDAERSYLNYCQPLIRGDYAQWLEFDRLERASGWDKDSGYTPVLRYPNDETHDEDEYLLSAYMQAEWDYNFNPGVYSSPGGYYGFQFKKDTLTKKPRSFPKIFPHTELPCIPKEDMPLLNTDPTYFPPPDFCGDPPPCPPYPYKQIPQDYVYGTSPRETPYCPNVEKITVPSNNPFTPRHDYGYYTGYDGIAHKTDREYSDDTSIPLINPMQWPTVSPCYMPDLDYYWGYNAWNGVGRTTDPQNPNLKKPWIENNAYPVQCAIVPVDILSFRAAAFDSCITQRINYNLNDFVVKWLQGYYPAPAEWDTLEGGLYSSYDREHYPWHTYSSFVPPCSTRFYEYDDMNTCPIKLSIQQCCHIIIKDVVPANFVKLRLQEGLADQRISKKIVYNSVWNPNDPDSSEYSYYLIDDLYGYNPTGRDLSLGDDFGNLYHSRINRNREGYWALQYAMCDTARLALYNGSPDVPGSYRFVSYFDAYGNEGVKDSPYTYAQDGEGNCYDLEWKPFKIDRRLLGYHMPYMRWWDTGVSPGNPRHGGSFLNTIGSWVTLIGVGREEISELDVHTSNQWQKYIDDNPVTGEQCTDPGIWPDLNIMQRPSEIGRMGQLTELYAAAAKGIRYDANFCIGRFERTQKLGSAEESVLALAGSSYTTRGNPNAGTTNAERINAPKPHDLAWKLGWRGYVTDTHGNDFPYFPYGNSDGILTDKQGKPIRNLDAARAGDIIVVQASGMPPQIMLVSSVKNDDTSDPDYFIKVVFWDQNKFPTSTYSTLAMGYGAERTIYRRSVTADKLNQFCNLTYRILTQNPVFPPNKLLRLNYRSDPKDLTPAPQDYDDCWNPSYDIVTPNFCYNKCQPDILRDTSYPHGVLPEQLWWNATIYRPIKDVRKCSDTGEKFYWTDEHGITTPSGFLMDKTYEANLQNTVGAPSRSSVLWQSYSTWVDANTFSACNNGGYDPFPIWQNINNVYSGAGTGALTQHYFCGTVQGYLRDKDGNIVKDALGRKRLNAEGWDSCNQPGVFGVVPVAPAPKPK